MKPRAGGRCYLDELQLEVATSEGVSEMTESFEHLVIVPEKKNCLDSTGKWLQEVSRERASTSA